MRNRDRGIPSENTFKAAQKPQATIERTQPRQVPNNDKPFLYVVGLFVTVLVFGLMLRHVDSTSIAFMVWIGVSFVLYFIPAIIAGVRNHKNQTAILVLNLFLGFTFIGWVWALVWAFTNKDA